MALGVQEGLDLGDVLVSSSSSSFPNGGGCYASSLMLDWPLGEAGPVPRVTSVTALPSSAPWASTSARALYSDS